LTMRIYNNLIRSGVRQYARIDDVAFVPTAL
jgi:hypothetical protein